MALEPRSYAPTGPTNAMLDNFVTLVGPNVAISVTMPRPTITINVENTVPDLIATLDDYMATLGYAPTTVSPKQVFQHLIVVAGAATITIPLPAARLSANYNVQVTFGGPGGGANALKLVRAIPSSFTTTQFDVELSDAVEANDIFLITVEDLT